jgi:tetratricopeptide (TPR) repeat protein
LEQPISRADAIYGEFKVKRLVSDYPFTETPITVELPDADTMENKMLHHRIQGGDWLTINQQLLTFYQQQQDYPEAAKIAGLLADALPNKTELVFIAGMLYKKAQNLPLSIYYLNKAVKYKVNPVQARLSLAQNYYLLGEKAKSLSLLQEAKQLQPNHPQIDNLINIVNNLNPG